MVSFQRAPTGQVAIVGGLCEVVLGDGVVGRVLTKHRRFLAAPLLIAGHLESKRIDVDKGILAHITVVLNPPYSPMGSLCR